MSMRSATLAGVALSLSLGASLPALAIPVELSFTANFPAGSPQTPVTGDFVYDAASVTSPITSLTSVDLTIAGHAYTLGEVGFFLTGGDEVIGSTTTPPRFGCGRGDHQQFFLGVQSIHRNPSSRDFFLWNSNFGFYLLPYELFAI